LLDPRLVDPGSTLIHVCAYDPSLCFHEDFTRSIFHLQGTVKQLIPLQENEGRPTIITVAGNFMIYGTDEGYMRVYDLSRR